MAAKESQKAEEWMDITELCRAAASSMTIHNAIISSGDFSLEKSMSAVELMDPKMDQCYNMPSSSLDTDSLMNVTVPDDFSYSLAAKVLHIVFVYETALVDGASALESTHQCLLLWEGSWATFPTTTLAQRAVLAYCKSLNLTLNRLCSCVADADIFEGKESHRHTE